MLLCVGCNTKPASLERTQCVTVHLALSGLTARLNSVHPAAGYPTGWFCDRVHPLTMKPTAKPNLKEYIASKEKKQRYVNRLFETIAGRYDFFTVFMSYGMDRGWKRKMIRMLKLTGGETTLDIACGTGDIAFMTAA